MMDSNAVAKYIAEHNLGGTNVETEEQVAPVEEVKTNETPSPASNDDSKSEPETSDQNVDEPKVEDTKPVEETEGEKHDDIVASEKEVAEHNETKPEHTHQEKVNYAFQKEKAKQKKLLARIRELEAENAELAKKNPNDIKDNSELIDYYVNKRTNEVEQQRLREEIQNSHDIEFETINEERIRNCFPDEVEQQKYDTLLKTNGPALLKELDEQDPEHAVLAYLDDSDISPLLIRILMTSDKYRNEVLKYKSPYGKYNALDKLAQKVEMAREQMANERKTPAPAPAQAPVVTNKVETPVAPKPAIPVIGSVTKSENDKGVVVKDYNQILHEMNMKRGYGR